MKAVVIAAILALCVACASAIKCHVCTGTDGTCSKETDCASTFDACVKGWASKLRQII